MIEEAPYEDTPIEGTSLGTRIGEDEDDDKHHWEDSQAVEDWGIEDVDGLDLEYDDDNEALHDTYANPNDTRVVDSSVGGTESCPSLPHYDPGFRIHFQGPNRSQIPVRLGSGRLFTEEERFRQSLRSLLGQRVSHEETNRFLDQFRYTIISSSLLEPQPLYNTWSLPADVRRRRLLFEQSQPWTELYVEPVFKATGSGGIVALCVLLHYKYKRAADSKERIVVAIIISIALIVYAFATSRRRLLRSLRKRSLIYMEKFAQCAKFFDGDCVRALRDLQDIDVVANGFAPNSRPNFITANSVIGGRKLRSVLASSLRLLGEAYLDAFKDCICMGSRSAIDQFLNIYDLKRQMQELNFEISETYVGFTEPDLPLDGPELCYLSVTELKRALQKVHMLRRAMLCCLLAAPSGGKSTVAELEVWTTICDHLLNCGSLAEQLSNLIINERLHPAEERREAQSQQQSQSQSLHPSSSQRPAALTRTLAAARHLSARLSLLNSELSGEELSAQISVVENEINDLSREWKKFVSLQNQSSRKFGAQIARNSRDFSNIVPSPTLVNSESGEISSFDPCSTHELDDYTSDATAIEYSQTSSVFEGESSAFAIPRSKLSREERIKLARRESEAPKQPSMAQRKNSLVLELNSVLSRRR